MKIRIY